MNAINQKLNYVSARDNPFAVQRTDAIPFDFSETSFACIESFYHHVQQFDFRGAILGKHGRGKTTLLCDLHSFLCQQGIRSELVFLPREKHLRRQSIDNTIQRGLSGSIILIDGLERATFLARQRILFRSKRYGGFIATTHRPSRLRTLLHCRTSQQTLITTLESLELNRPEIVTAALPLLSKHCGNIRFVLRELYDQCADGKFG